MTCFLTFPVSPYYGTKLERQFNQYESQVGFFFPLFLCFFLKDVLGLFYFARQLKAQQMRVGVVEIVNVHAAILDGNISNKATIPLHKYL